MGHSYLFKGIQGAATSQQVTQGLMKSVSDIA